MIQHPVYFVKILYIKLIVTNKKILFLYFGLPWQKPRIFDSPPNKNLTLANRPELPEA